ncbi:MAG: polyphosphate kinase 2 family protein [Propionibacteriaceae bacterium]|jgi:PPK2 family polyphosphate:nucleotide phosphotransferase|nr:polyphosphate kinase 2 family protein [Propionibacteriaceae bacterium]
MAKKKHHSTKPLDKLLRVPDGPVRLADHDSAATPGYPGKGKQDAPALTAALVPELSDLQERLYANSKFDAEAPNVLLILQGLDTAGKGGVIRHAIGLVDPQGVKIHAFKTPSAEERKHHYLWRVRKALPERGIIGIFDRSQYEDVLVVRVDSLVGEDVWSQRYAEINEFEAELAAAGTKIIKCMLHVSQDEQAKRLEARLLDRTKHWKYNPSDLDTRAKWPAYQEAYEAALTLCNTAAAPWHIVPSDRKWYRNWAVAELLREALASLNLEWPKATYDVSAELERLRGM